jgi:hypothetical protein
MLLTLSSSKKETSFQAKNWQLRRAILAASLAQRVFSDHLSCFDAGFPQRLAEFEEWLAENTTFSWRKAWLDHQARPKAGQIRNRNP